MFLYFGENYFLLLVCHKKVIQLALFFGQNISNMPPPESIILCPAYRTTAPKYRSGVTTPIPAEIIH